MIKLAIITTHPIQYNAPLFTLLSAVKNIYVKVFYTWGESVLEDKFDPGFGKKIKWDIDLLSGYDYQFIENISKNPSSKNFKGIDNPSLKKEVQDWGATALLVYGWNLKSHLNIIRFFHGKIPVYFRGDSTLLKNSSGFRSLLRKIALQFVYRNIDTAFYVGSENKKYFEMFGMRENQLIFAPHAVNNTFFKPDKNGGSIIRKSINIPATALVFLYAGKLEYVKNVKLLLTAFLKLTNTDVYLLIAGEGPELHNLRAFAATNDKVKFIPFQNQTQMPALYTCGDVFVLPSTSETWGLGVNEAMSCGRAVLVSDHCGCASDLVVPGQNGQVFASGNVEVLLSQMKWFITNQSDLTKMGEVSKEIIASFTYVKIVKSIQQKLMEDAG